MRSFPASTRALVLTLAFVPAAFAWGPQGHRTIGAIADRLLTPEARAVVGELLAADRDKFGNPSGRTTLECNSAQLERLTGVLADPRAAPRARNEALKWIVHLLGDLHQPLHAADNGDLGGNRVLVALAGVRSRGRLTLHGAWDTELVTLALHTRGHQQPPADIDALAREAQSLSAEAGQGTPAEWASQSNNLARNVAYQYPGFACGVVPEGIVVLDQNYQDEAEAIVRERLLLAGGRLANLLNEILVTR